MKEPADNLLVGKQYYQFTMLPFGLSTVPQFTKCTAIVAAYRRQQDIQVFLYLDEWLIKDHSKHKSNTASGSSESPVKHWA